MKSCWLIEFKSGNKVMISESLYKEQKERDFKGREVVSESHLFDFRTCIERKQGVLVAGF